MEFRTVIGFEDYEINEEGVVRDIVSKVLRRKYHRNPKYEYVHFWKDGKDYNIGINVLLAQNFPPPDLEGEIWKPINNFPKYAVSNHGRIKNTRSHHILKPYPDKDGYLDAQLSRDGVAHHNRLHRLVANAFIPNPDNLPIIDHLDGNTSNNHVNNLRWATLGQNMQNSHSRGRCQYKGVHISTVTLPCGTYNYIRATIQGNHIGQYDTEEEAARAYDAKAREIFGEQARVNFP